MDILLEIKIFLDCLFWANDLLDVIIVGIANMLYHLMLIRNTLVACVCHFDAEKTVS